MFLFVSRALPSQQSSSPPAADRTPAVSDPELNHLRSPQSPSSRFPSSVPLLRGSLQKYRPQPRLSGSHWAGRSSRRSPADSIIHRRTPPPATSCHWQRSNSNPHSGASPVQHRATRLIPISVLEFLGLPVHVSCLIASIPLPRARTPAASNIRTSAYSPHAPHPHHALTAYSTRRGRSPPGARPPARGGPWTSMDYGTAKPRAERCTACPRTRFASAPSPDHPNAAHRCSPMATGIHPHTGERPLVSAIRFFSCSRWPRRFPRDGRIARPAVR